MIAERGNIGWNINKEYDGSNELTMPGGKENDDAGQW